MATKKKKIPVLVTTSHRGVYFGWTDNPDAEIVKLERSRHVFRYERHPDSAHRGVYGLATAGPQPGSKIGPAVSSRSVRCVVNVVSVDESALPAWEAATWE